MFSCTSVGASKRRSVLEVIERIDVFPCQLGKSSTSSVRHKFSGTGSVDSNLLSH